MVAVDRAAASAATGVPPTRADDLRWVTRAVAVLPPLTYLAYLVTRSRDTWAYLFTDDAFYYLGVARNLGSGDGSTFTGLTETNGYHPLWELALSALARVVPDMHVLLAAVVVVQCALWIVLVYEAVRIGRAVGSEAAALCGVALLGVLGVVTGQLSFSGMESAPLLVMLMLAIRLFVTHTAGDARGELRLGLVFALVTLTRLDAGLVVLALATPIALEGRPPIATVVRRAGRLLAPMAVGLGVYMVTNLVIFGTATPVSGQAKSLGGPFLNFQPVRRFLEAGEFDGRAMWLGVVALVLTAIAYWSGVWRTSTERRRLMGVTGCILASQVLLLAYLIVATSYPVWAWYFYGIATILFCAGTLVAQALIRWLGAHGRRVCLGVAAAFAVLQAPALYLSNYTHGPEATATADFLANDIPDGSVLAMGDRAGLVGYFADQPLLQTEGLMADEQWLRDLEDGTALERMIDEGVDYIVWAGPLPDTHLDRDGVPCRVLTEPRAGDGPKFDITVCLGDRVFDAGTGGDTFTVYRFRPEHHR
jgi:hypothetical protein